MVIIIIIMVLKKLETLTVIQILHLQKKKLTVIYQFIRPTLIYPFQLSPTDKSPRKYIMKADYIIVSAVKESLQLPSLTPNSRLYTSSKYKGLSILRATWEMYLQQLNINYKLETANNSHINAVRDYSAIKITACRNCR